VTFSFFYLISFVVFNRKMGRRGQKGDQEVLSPKKVRQQNREYIRTEQNSATFQWTNFKENCKREDKAALRFKQLLMSKGKNVIPPDIDFIIQKTRKEVAKKFVENF